MRFNLLQRGSGGQHGGDWGHRGQGSGSTWQGAPAGSSAGGKGKGGQDAPAGSSAGGKGKGGKGAKRSRGDTPAAQPSRREQDECFLRCIGYAILVFLTTMVYHPSVITH